MPELYSGTQVIDGEVYIGWTAAVSPESIAVVFQHRHWERMRGLPGVEYDRTRIESDIDGLCRAVKNSLLKQVEQTWQQDASQVSPLPPAATKRRPATRSWRGVFKAAISTVRAALAPSR